MYSYRSLQYRTSLLFSAAKGISETSDSSINYQVTLRILTLHTCGTALTGELSNNGDIFFNHKFLSIY